MSLYSKITLLALYTLGLFVGIFIIIKTGLGFIFFLAGGPIYSIVFLSLIGFIVSLVMAIFAVIKSTQRRIILFLPLIFIVCFLFFGISADYNIKKSNYEDCKRYPSLLPTFCELTIKKGKPKFLEVSGSAINDLVKILLN